MPKIIELNDYHDLRLQKCFRRYFTEIGEHLRENTTVFERMQEAVTEQNMHCLVLMDEADICGFLQFQTEELTHSMGFFKETVGFIREFWISPEERGKGNGARLLSAVEDHFRKEGVCKLILTYEENALSFYEKQGFTIDRSYTAENEQGVVVKLLR